MPGNLGIYFDFQMSYLLFEIRESQKVHSNNGERQAIWGVENGKNVCMRISVTISLKYSEYLYI